MLFQLELERITELARVRTDGTPVSHRLYLNGSAEKDAHIS